jgi:hypothetical protein
MDKKTVSLYDLESQTAVRLPDRQMLTLLYVKASVHVSAKVGIGTNCFCR